MLKKISGFPKNSNDYDKWIKQGRVWKDGSWWEKTTTNKADNNYNKSDIINAIKSATRDYAKNPSGFREKLITSLTGKYGDKAKNYINKNVYLLLPDTGTKDTSNADSTSSSNTSNNNSSSNKVIKKNKEQEETRYGYGLLGEKFSVTGLSADYNKWLSGKGYTKEYTAPKTLKEYYGRLNETNPDFKGKASLFNELGFGNTKEYYGTSEQDKELLAKLLENSQSNYTSNGGLGNTAIEETNVYAKMLTGDTKQLYNQYMHMLENGSIEEQKAWKEALGLASKNSNAFFAEKLNILKDSFETATGTLSNNLEDNLARLTDRKNRITEDLSTFKSDLTLEESSALARRKQIYDNAITDTKNSMANRGLSSSSIRIEAESRLSQKNTSVIEGITRSADRQLRNKNTEYNRGLEDINALVELNNRKATENKRSYVRGLEDIIGTDKLKTLGNLGGLDISSYSLGNVTGSIDTAQSLDIMNRTNTILSGAGY